MADTELWRSVVRHGYPDNDVDRSLAVFSNVFLHLHPVRVRRRTLRFTTTFGMGFISAVLFLLLVLTGCLVMVYYVPDTARAYRDLKDLEFVVPFGGLLRGMHRWAAHGMVLTVILHMARVFYAGAYKSPRQFNWVIGVVLLTLTLLLSFTGYLLPWDQLAYWAITVGSNMAKAVPFLGAEGPFHELLGVTESNDVRFLLLGGTEIGQSALIRFYVLHCVILPLVLTMLLAVHVWRVRKDGGLAAPGEEEPLASAPADQPSAEPAPARGGTRAPAPVPPGGPGAPAGTGDGV